MEKKIKLQIKNIDKHYKNGDGVSNISFDVYEGEFVTILGPSGCGKSTILRTLGGFLTIDKGEIVIDNVVVDKLPPEKRPTAMVFQSYNLWPHMTVYENLAFGLKIKKMSKQEIKKNITSMLKMVKMSGFENKYPSQISGGQQQRVAIARALLLKPSVLLLDEPFSALDAKIRNQMREELKRIQQELNISVVFVTHDQEEAMAISDKIVVMNKGVIEQIGSPTEIYDNPVNKFVASFIGEMNFINLDNKKVLAVRPEDVAIKKEINDNDMTGVVKSIMILGHYVRVSIDTNNTTIKAFLSRKLADKISIEDNVSLSFNKKYIYNI